MDEQIITTEFIMRMTRANRAMDTLIYETCGIRRDEFTRLQLLFILKEYDSQGRGVTMTQLAEYAAMRRAFLSGLVHELIRDNLIENAELSDRRYVLIRITEEGRQYYRKAIKAYNNKLRLGLYNGKIPTEIWNEKYRKALIAFEIANKQLYEFVHNNSDYNIDDE